MSNNALIMSRIGIMQGRLVPPESGRFQCFPRGGWRNEFAFAAAAGIETIEWIYDAYGEDINPIASDEGVAEIKRLSAEHGVAIVSLCADYFMDQPLVRASAEEERDRVSRLYWLIERARRIGVRRVVLPFVDASRIDDANDERTVTRILDDVMPFADRAEIELHLETALSPAGFAALLARVGNPNVKVNYDSGNSASLGYDSAEEFAAYGARIGSVHIKDRVLHGSTVPLGSGHANLPAVFAGLRSLDYNGDYILQVARGEEGAEVDWARRNSAAVRSAISTASYEFSDRRY